MKNNLLSNSSIILYKILVMFSFFSCREFKKNRHHGNREQLYDLIFYYEMHLIIKILSLSKDDTFFSAFHNKN